MGDGDPDIWIDRVHREDEDDDGSDCWIRHEGMAGSSESGIKFRINGQDIWLPRSQITARTGESVQVTRWLKGQRPELFQRHGRDT